MVSGIDRLLSGQNDVGGHSAPIQSLDHRGHFYCFGPRADNGPQYAAVQRSP
jgi:hypothetical protein